MRLMRCKSCASIEHGIRLHVGLCTGSLLLNSYHYGECRYGDDKLWLGITLSKSTRVLQTFPQNLLMPSDFDLQRSSRQFTKACTE